jgi:outer membrane immunogenic protein
MKTVWALGIVSGVLLGGSVQAADIQFEDDFVLRDGIDWTGFYAGFNLGYGWGSAESVVGTLDPTGWIAGVQAGYNYDLGSFVVGVEADIQWTDMAGSATSGGITATGQLDYFGTVRGRLGVAVDQMLPYVTAGLLYGQGTVTSTFGGGMTSTVFMTGWAAGAGVDYAISDNLLLRGELLYADYGPETYFAGTVIEETQSSSFVAARMGMNYKF